MHESSIKAARGLAARTVVVILAAGKGTRMGRADLAKVCFEIDGVPAVNRTIRTFRSLGFERFMLVVGACSEQVQATVNAEHPGVLYVYQSPQLGTGHAARVAAEALAAMNHQGGVLVTMGDKFMDARAVDALRDGFVRQDADLALLSIPRTGTAGTDGGGRIFIDHSGQALDIIETTDLARQAIADDLRKCLARAGAITPRTIAACIRRRLPNAGKQAVAVPELMELVRKAKTADREVLRKLLDTERYNLRIGGRNYSAARIEALCKTLNPSLYFFKAPAFYEGVRRLDNDNAQGEYYLTDTVKHLAAASGTAEAPFRVRVVPIVRPEWIQGFNSPDELLRIQDYLRGHKAGRRTAASPAAHPPRRGHRAVRSWIERIAGDAPAYRRWLTRIYGDHPDLHRDKTRNILRLLRAYGRRFGFERPVCIVRAPGRINLMGRHVDHRGGYNNFLAIHRETLAVAGRRDDDRVVAFNLQPRKFAPVEFSIAELIGNFGWTDWINFVNSDWVRAMLHGSAGDWGNYIKAAMLRLQHHYQDLRINGLNLAVYGDIPMAAGLSSSSSIVVATLQAGIALNNLELTAGQIVDLCGQGEWFVGSRGGSGDHAAICLGQRGKITQVGYLPFRIEKVIDSPPDYQVIIADSHVKAAKSNQAKHQFNARIAAYNLGLALLRRRSPVFRDALEHVRDIDPQRLGCPPSRIYALLKQVPGKMTRRELRSALGGEIAELLETNFSTHQDPGSYLLRGVLLFGAAETMRGRLCIDLLESGRMREFGRLMRISHEGDRVSRADAAGRYIEIEDGCTEAYLDRLAADLASEDPCRVRDAQIQMQPGYYACSTPAIDRMVDLVSAIPGVAGAQIAGAGLGGCVMIVARMEALHRIRKTLVRDYYAPANLNPSVIPCVTTQGAGLAEF